MADDGHPTRRRLLQGGGLRHPHDPLREDRRQALVPQGRGVGRLSRADDERVGLFCGIRRLPVLCRRCAPDIKLRHPGSGDVAVCEGGYPTGLAGLVRKDLQTGESAIGVWNTSGGQSGTLTAAVGAVDSGLRLKQLNPCDGEFVGTAVVEDNGSRLRGSYRGRDCSQSVTASFSVRR